MANINRTMKILKQSIDKNIPIIFSYNSKHSDVLKGPEITAHRRVCQPVVIGKRVTRDGYKTYVRCYLLGQYSYKTDSVYGGSNTQVNSHEYWRLYSVIKIINPKLHAVYPFRFDVTRKDYNPHDRWMSTILYAMPKPTGSTIPAKTNKQSKPVKGGQEPAKESIQENLLIDLEWQKLSQDILKEQGYTHTPIIYSTSENEEIGCIEQGIIYLNRVWLEQSEPKQILKGIKRLCKIYKMDESEIESETTIPIPTAIKNNYEVTNSIADVKNWKAKIYLNNNAPSDAPKKVGDMDIVGYIGVGIKTGVIVPIAKQDEHHAGYDLLQYLKRKELIPVDQYVTVYMYRATYVSKEDQVKMIGALKILLRYGLNPNLQIKDWDRKGVCTAEEYVQNKGFKPMELGYLTPTGNNIISNLETVTLAYKRFVENNNIKTEEHFIMAAKEFIAFISEYALDLDLGEIENYWDRIKAIMDSEDSKELADFIFSHSGIKNIMHIRVKELIAKKDTFMKSYYDDLQNLVGDLDVFLDELNRLSVI